MPRFIRPPKTIEQRGGVEAYLNATRDQHNGLGYKAWWRRVDPRRKKKVPRSSIAEDFGVSKQTVYTWLSKDTKYQEELTDCLEEQLDQDLGKLQTPAPEE